MWPRRTVVAAVLLLTGLWFVSVHAAPMHQVVIDQLAYTPVEITVKVGDTVEWVNKDIVDHTATAKNGDWHVEIEAGKKASLVMKKAGTFDYYCEYHPNMTAKVIVEKK